jgi:hypothetical protein
MKINYEKNIINHSVEVVVAHLIRKNIPNAIARQYQEIPFLGQIMHRHFRQR